LNDAHSLLAALRRPLVHVAGLNRSRGSEPNCWLTFSDPVQLNLQHLSSRSQSSRRSRGSEPNCWLTFSDPVQLNLQHLSSRSQSSRRSRGSEPNCWLTFSDPVQLNLQHLSSRSQSSRRSRGSEPNCWLARFRAHPNPPPPGVSRVNTSPGCAVNDVLGGKGSPLSRLRPDAAALPPARPHGA